MIDPRYKTIQGLLKEGAIEKFTDIFNWIPYTVVADHFGGNGWGAGREGEEGN